MTLSGYVVTDINRDLDYTRTTESNMALAAPQNTGINMASSVRTSHSHYQALLRQQSPRTQSAAQAIYIHIHKPGRSSYPGEEAWKKDTKMASGVIIEYCGHLRRSSPESKPCIILGFSSCPELG